MGPSPITSPFFIETDWLVESSFVIGSECVVELTEIFSVYKFVPVSDIKIDLLIGCTYRLKSVRLYVRECVEEPSSYVDLAFDPK